MAGAEAPTLGEIIELTRSELTAANSDDEICNCGRPALSLLLHDPETCLQLAYQKLHDAPYKEVKTCWRRLYTDAALWKALKVLQLAQGQIEDTPKEKEVDINLKVGLGGADWVTAIVRILDMALILTGAPSREELVELWFSGIQGFLSAQDSHIKLEDASVRPLKRRKLSKDTPPFPGVVETFVTTLSDSPTLQYPIPRVDDISLEAFQKRIEHEETQIPVVITGAIDHWPAMSERSWNRPSYLLEHTLGGRRLVPVEIGRSYTDDGWGQKILSFGEFMKEYMFPASKPQDQPSSPHIDRDETNGSTEEKHGNVEETADNKTGYLAQHDLLSQISSLRSDICIPDYCYSSPPLHRLEHIKPVSKLEEPLLNTWFGPGGTISPLHTDPYHNILAQVMGYKYLRLYGPKETERLYPRGTEEGGIDMSNTSRVDLDEFWQLNPERSSIQGFKAKPLDAVKARGFEDQFPNFIEAEYVEAVLAPGECLYVPVGWWHYVRSLTPSFSVSFWFN